MFLKNEQNQAFSYGSSFYSSVFKDPKLFILRQYSTNKKIKRHPKTASTTTSTIVKLVLLKVMPSLINAPNPNRYLAQSDVFLNSYLLSSTYFVAFSRFHSFFVSISSRFTINLM